MKYLYPYILLLLFSVPSLANTNPPSPWVANENGVSYYDSKSKSYVDISTLLPDSVNLPNNYLTSIQIDNSGIWIHTKSTILLQFDPITQQINFWDEEAPIPYTFSESESENKDEEALIQKTWFWLILVIALIGIILLHLVMQRRQMLAEKKAVITHQKLLRSQMNPHFIFNAISAIQNDIMLKPAKEASRHLAKFAALIRQFLDSSKRELIELEREVKMLKNYVALQQLRYSDKFSFSITIDEDINTENTMIPPMLNQPFVENAIEHGIKQLDSGGYVSMRIIKVGNILIFEIEDNGVGIKNQKNQNLHEHKSFAIEATSNRIKLAHSKSRTEHTFDIIDKESLNQGEQGTLIRYSIPHIAQY